MWVRRDSAIKKLLKIFLFIFSIYFTIKILLKNTLLSLIHKTKKEEGKISPFYPLGWEFRLFQPDSGPISACFGHFGPFGPFWSPVDTDWYGPILVESTPFSANRSQIGANRAELAQIQKKKKKTQMWHQRASNHVGPHRTRVWHPPSHVHAFQGKTKKRRRVPEVLWQLFHKRARSLACTIESLLPSSMSSLVRDEKDPPQYRKLLNQCFLVLSENAPPLSRFNPHSRWSQSQIVRRTIEILIFEQPMSSNVICNAYDKASFLSFFLLLTMLLLSTFFGKRGLQINHSTPIMELLCSPAWCLLLQRVLLLCFGFFFFFFFN